MKNPRLKQKGTGYLFAQLSVITLTFAPVILVLQRDMIYLANKSTWYLFFSGYLFWYKVREVGVVAFLIGCHRIRVRATWAQKGL